MTTELLTQTRPWMPRAILAVAITGALVSLVLPAGASWVPLVHGLVLLGGWGLLGVVATEEGRSGSRRARSSHAALVAAVVAGVLATFVDVVRVSGVMDLRTLAAWLAWATFAGLLLTFSLREISGRRWNAAAGTSLDSAILAAVVVAIASPWLAGGGAALVLVAGFALAATFAPLIGPFRRGGRLDRPSAAVALATGLLGSSWIFALRSQEPASAFRFHVAVASLAVGGLAILVHGGVLVRSAARSRSARARYEWAILGLELLGVLVALVVSVALAIRGTSPRSSGVALGGLASLIVLLLVREALARRVLGALLASLERQRREQASADKLTALGEFSRLVAHEIRNSLSVLYSSVSLLERDRPREQRLELLDTVQEEAERMADVVSQLTTFAREGPLEPAPMDLDELVREAVAAARRKTSWPPDVEVDLELHPSAAIVLADWTRLEVAVTHVLSCAAQGGASRVEIRESRIHRDGEDFARISIDGNGRLIDEALYSGGASALTASRMEGGALGMAIARRAVREHGGAFEQSTPRRRGLHVSIELPLATR